MFSRKPTWLVLMTMLTASLLITSCNFGAAPAPTTDVNALSTALVGTTVAQLSVELTETAQAAPTNTIAPTATVTAQSFEVLPTGTSGTAPTQPTVISFANTAVPGATTAVAAFTQVSVLPTQPATASLGDACNNAVFEGDVTIPDGSVLKPGEDFTKVWAIRNSGSCTWDEGYKLVFIGGDTAMDPVNYVFGKKNTDTDFVSPGEGVNIGIPLTAPLAEGKYTGTWRMQTDSGVYFGTYLTVNFEVKKP